MSDEQLVYQPEVTVLLETDDAIVANYCLSQLNQQRWPIDARLAGKPGTFQITCRLAGAGEPTADQRVAYDEAAKKASAFCRGFISGWHSRRA